MKFTSESLKLYAITDRQWLKNKSLPLAVEDAIKGGATLIQLREKNITYEDLKRLALDVKSVTDKYNIPLIINDNVELCKEIDADGVHVGANDISVKKARQILGKNKIVGGTARTLERAIQAYTEGADYLGIGSVFNTTTKSGTTHMTGELARSINNTVNIPTVAIGGINLNNASQLSDYGVSGIAVVSAIFAQDDITSACIKLREIVDKFKS